MPTSSSAAAVAGFPARRKLRKTLLRSARTATRKRAYGDSGACDVRLSGATRLVVVGGRIDLKYPAGPPDRHTPFTTRRVNQLALPGRP
jgi:hypothetical protein